MRILIYAGMTDVLAAKIIIIMAHGRQTGRFENSEEAHDPMI